MTLSGWYPGLSSASICPGKLGACQPSVRGPGLFPGKCFHFLFSPPAEQPSYRKPFPSSCPYRTPSTRTQHTLFPEWTIRSIEGITQGTTSI